MKIVTIDALTSPTTELLGMIAIFLGLLPGAYLVLRDTTSIWGIKLATAPMDVAELSALYSLVAGISDPGRKLSSVYAKLKRASAASDRVFAFLDRCPSVRQVAHAKSLPRHSKSIEFGNIEFSYENSNAAQRPAVLTDFSLDVAAGEVIALVGTNGSGKSTLVNLLPRFFDPQRGTVSIDGVDIREARLKDLRAQIGMVTQETLLFDETIYDNIRYGLPGASAQAVHAAAEKAHVLDFGQQFPEGIHTCVGDKGSRLSGGQRQRVALARAILRDPAILILDEATSAIDAESEYLIHQVLKEFVKGRTTFIITHSVGHSILELVTRICIMEDGQLAGAGTHEELLRNCPAYQRLYSSQALQASAQMDGDGRLSA